MNSGYGKHEISLNQGLTLKELMVSMGRGWPISRENFPHVPGDDTRDPVQYCESGSLQ